MSDTDEQRRAPVVGFLHPQGDTVLIGELESGFLKRSSLGPTSWERPLRVELEPKLSKKGNTFFDYQQVIPLPDGVETHMMIDGIPLEPGEIGQSQRGNPNRKHSGIVEIGSRKYEVAAYIAVTKKGCWVKVHAHVASPGRSSSSANIPQGGRLI